MGRIWASWKWSVSQLVPTPPSNDVSIKLPSLLSRCLEQNICSTERWNFRWTKVSNKQIAQLPAPHVSVRSRSHAVHATATSRVLTAVIQRPALDHACSLPSLDPIDGNVPPDAEGNQVRYGMNSFVLFLWNISIKWRVSKCPFHIFNGCQSPNQNGKPACFYCKMEPLSRPIRRASFPSSEFSGWLTPLLPVYITLSLHDSESTQRQIEESRMHTLSNAGTVSL